MENINQQLATRRENQDELEGILMEEIKKESTCASSENNIIAELARALIELWKMSVL